MNTSGCPACCWLLCLQFICVVLNHLASPTLQGICPVQALEGTTPDISFLLHFSFYDPVYDRIDSSEPDLNFPSSSNEKKGYWVGFADNQGDCLTWRILTEDTHKIIICSGVRSALRTDTIPTKNGLELVEKGVSELMTNFMRPNWERMLSCAYTTQLMHSTVEVCWNINDSYFVWFKFVCRKSGK